MKLNDAMIERAARGICAGRSLDPDDWYKYTSGSKVPLWTVYEKDARAALEAALSECCIETVEATEGPYGEYGVILTESDLIGKRVALVPLED